MKLTGTADFVVVGAGLAGTATAWQLASRGLDVMLVEQDVPAGRQGSSHGSARIFRYAYEDPFYAGAVVEAKGMWDALEMASGERLLAVRSFVLPASCRASPAGSHSPTPRMSRSALRRIGPAYSRSWRMTPSRSSAGWTLVQ